jgi:hypothetical protein
MWTELTGQGFMRSDIILLGGGCFFWPDRGEGLVLKRSFKDWRFANSCADHSSMVPLVRCRKFHMQGSLWLSGVFHAYRFDGNFMIRAAGEVSKKFKKPRSPFSAILHTPII